LIPWPIPYLSPPFGRVKGVNIPVLVDMLHPLKAAESGHIPEGRKELVYLAPR
jgi:hypothetical protein